MDMFSFLSVINLTIKMQVNKGMVIWREGERSGGGRRRRRRRRRRRDKVTSHFTFMTDPNESLRYSDDVLLVFENPGLFGFGLS